MRQLRGSPPAACELRQAALQQLLQLRQKQRAPLNRLGELPGGFEGYSPILLLVRISPLA
ncbi:hypothetical protein D3C85_1165640 [compost metagenome]